MARKVKVSSKCPVVLVLSCVEKVELLRDHPLHPLHSLLRHSSGSAPCASPSHSSAALPLGEVIHIRDRSLVVYSLLTTAK